MRISENHQRVEKPVNESCAKVMVGTSALTLLALAIIGALALVGVCYPTNPLGVLGQAFGLEGSCAAIIAGTLASISIVLSYCLCQKPPKKIVEEQPQEVEEKTIPQTKPEQKKYAQKEIPLQVGNGMGGGGGLFTN